MTLRSLYPALSPYKTGYLRVDDIHEIYWEQSGNPDGVPVVFLHGGPGGGTSPRHRQFFDPKHYRIILFDQRGAGKSRPAAELRNNTTKHLVADIEALRKFLGIDRWHVFGGSWGSTLALCYAIAHPKRCLSLTLRGIFMMQGEEIDWFLYGMKTVFPEAWGEFVEILPERQRKNILGNYYKLLTHKDPKIRLAAARKWSKYETVCSTLLPASPAALKSTDAFDLAISRIEAHYFLKNRFKPDNYILKNIHKIRKIPATIVQGRYDIICPFRYAWSLHKAWPEAEFICVKDAGHSAFEPGIASALVTSTDKFRKIKA